MWRSAYFKRHNHHSGSLHKRCQKETVSSTYYTFLYLPSNTKFSVDILIERIALDSFPSSRKLPFSGLTLAAIFISRFRPSQFTAKVGEWDLNDSDSYSEELRIIDITAHPDFKPNGFYNDVALFKLEQPVRYSE